jgi:hypothetical protein
MGRASLLAALVRGAIAGAGRVSRAGRKLHAGAMDRDGVDPPGTAPACWRARALAEGTAPELYPKIRAQLSQSGKAQALRVESECCMKGVRL